jgi:L-alanine-DL-glutamate epimerase and related enzymes of enolase superfamily
LIIFLGHGLPIHSSWAPVDVALWDIAGKEVGKPIYSLLGGKKKEIEIYATYPPRYNTPEGFINEAKELVMKNFSF